MRGKDMIFIFRNMWELMGKKIEIRLFGII